MFVIIIVVIILIIVIIIINVTVTLITVILSLRFNGHFPGGPGLADTRMSPLWILLELRAMEVVSDDNWNYKMCKAPVKLSPSSNLHPTFYRPDALPVAQPTVSELLLLYCLHTDDDTDVGSSMKILLETFLNNLPNCVSRELIDKVSGFFNFIHIFYNCYTTVCFFRVWHQLSGVLSAGKRTLLTHNCLHSAISASHQVTFKHNFELYNNVLFLKELCLFCVMLFIDIL